jgi:hypothetical protein
MRDVAGNAIQQHASVTSAAPRHTYRSTSPNHADMSTLAAWRNPTHAVKEFRPRESRLSGSMSAVEPLAVAMGSETRAAANVGRTDLLKSEEDSKDDDEVLKDIFQFTKGWDWLNSRGVAATGAHCIETVRMRVAQGGQGNHLAYERCTVSVRSVRRRPAYCEVLLLQRSRTQRIGLFESTWVQTSSRASSPRLLCICDF